MTISLNRQQKDEFVKRGFSRRDLGRVAAMITAGVALPFWNEPAMDDYDEYEAKRAKACR